MSETFTTLAEHKFGTARFTGTMTCQACGLLPMDDEDFATSCPEVLNDIMEFDHVIRVWDDGTVTDAHGVYAPELYFYADADGQISDEWEQSTLDELKTQGWSVMTGRTGQYGYSGPIMHPSEFIGGGMASAILANPGYYVALVANVLSDDPDEEPAGWVVAYREVTP